MVTIIKILIIMIINLLLLLLDRFKTSVTSNNLSKLIVEKLPANFLNLYFKCTFKMTERHNIQ
jgi:hypothetical protein